MTFPLKYPEIKRRRGGDGLRDDDSPKFKFTLFQTMENLLSFVFLPEPNKMYNLSSSGEFEICEAS